MKRKYNHIINVNLELSDEQYKLYLERKDKYKHVISCDRLLIEHTINKFDFDDIEIMHDHTRFIDISTLNLKDERE